MTFKAVLIFSEVLASQVAFLKTRNITREEVRRVFNAVVPLTAGVVQAVYTGLYSREVYLGYVHPRDTPQRCTTMSNNDGQQRCTTMSNTPLLGPERCRTVGYS